MEAAHERSKDRMAKPPQVPRLPRRSFRPTAETVAWHEIDAMQAQRKLAMAEHEAAVERIAVAYLDGVLMRRFIRSTRPARMAMEEAYRMLGSTTEQAMRTAEVPGEFRRMFDRVIDLIAGYRASLRYHEAIAHLGDDADSNPNRESP